MSPALLSLAFALALACAATMGFAIQRGATCTVAAVQEVFARRTAYRLLALAEAAAWVAGGLALAREAGLIAKLPAAQAVSLGTVAGGVLLGLGAYLNRACVFGAIARLGSGEWAYLLTPAGFFLGVAALRLVPLPAPVPASGPGFVLPGWAVLPIALLALARAVMVLRRGRAEGGVWRRVWRPHEATTVIGIAFVVMMICAGAWAYTELLADLAAGMARDLAPRLALFAALLAGAVLGGWTAGRLARRAITAEGAARCLGGGALMGAGSALIPGSNDGLILTGMPLLQPHAWIAIAAMGLTIAAGFAAERRAARPAA